LAAFAEMASLALNSESLRGALSDEHRRQEWDSYFARTMHHFTSALTSARDVVTSFRSDNHLLADMKGPIVALIDELVEKHANLNSIASSLRDYSRPPISSFAKVSVRNLIEQVEREFDDVAVSLGDANFMVSGDSKRLKEALCNLLANAKEAFDDHPERPRRSIQIRLESVPGLEGRAIIEVKDFAGGFQRDILDQIGKPWTTTKKGPPRGLGLSIVKRIVEAHGGSLRVDSPLDVGSSILIELPIFQEGGDVSMQNLLLVDDDSEKL